MTRFRFVHAADLHLDTPFEDVGRVPDQVAAVLRDASLAAWDRLVALVIERDASFLLLAGDLYDGSERGVRAQLHFRDGLERLAQRGVQIFIVYGNHDPLSGWPAVASWPSGVTVFGSSAVASAPAIRDGNLLAVVHGISYARADTAENLALGFRRGPQAALHVGLLHANVGAQPSARAAGLSSAHAAGLAEHAPCAPCSLDDLRAAGLDYWALGHVHRRAYLREGSPWIVYPGNLQSRRHAAGELGAKGAVVVEAEGDRIANVEFAALDSVRYLDVEADLSGAPDLASLRALLTARAEALRGEHAGCGLVLTAVLRGRRGAPSGGARPEWSEELLDDLRRAEAGRSPFAWWTAIEDRSVPEVDPAPLVERDDLIGALLRRARELEGDAARRAHFLDRSAEPLIRKWVAELDPGDADGVLQDGRDLVFELLRRAGER